MEYRKRLEKKLIKQQELSKVWVKDLIPNWLKIRKDKKIKDLGYLLTNPISPKNNKKFKGIIKKLSYKKNVQTSK